MDRDFLDELAQTVSPGSLLKDPADLLTYESDALVHLRATPGAVVLPRSAEEVQAVVDSVTARRRAVCRARSRDRPLRRRAAVTRTASLIGLSRMNRILDVDIPNLRVSRSNRA